MDVDGPSQKSVLPAGGGVARMSCAVELGGREESGAHKSKSEKMSAAVTQIVARRVRNGRPEALVQWACSWMRVVDVVDNGVVQWLDSREAAGGLEVLVQWAATWVDIDGELMDGDLWQPFLDSEACDEADEDRGKEKGKETEEETNKKEKQVKKVKQPREREAVVMGSRMSKRVRGEAVSE
jgi:hypothetical protein